MTQADWRTTIEIVPRAVFVAEQSDPAAGRYAFGYEIGIYNHSAIPVTLLDRHWLIDHGNGEIVEVSGEGVVGETPTIAPGNLHRYRSGAIIQTPAGCMWGDYGFISQDGERFRVAIPRFDLIAPRAYRVEH
ncbi:MAG TPA: Co2+/Mg2+ efflux protein ApaG [Halothiobacillaceae bacterium]|nr:Co2+/Mg2+ efflux protein ApaG [Halothiobacillaceae bacterium]